jgi:hypothetical protein
VTQGRRENLCPMHLVSLRSCGSAGGISHSSTEAYAPPAGARPVGTLRALPAGEGGGRTGTDPHRPARTATPTAGEGRELRVLHASTHRCFYAFTPAMAVAWANHRRLGAYKYRLQKDLAITLEGRNLCDAKKCMRLQILCLKRRGRAIIILGSSVNGLGRGLKWFFDSEREFWL